MGVIECNGWCSFYMVASWALTISAFCAYHVPQDQISLVIIIQTERTWQQTLSSLSQQLRPFETGSEICLRVHKFGDEDEFRRFTRLTITSLFVAEDAVIRDVGCVISRQDTGSGFSISRTLLVGEGQSILFCFSDFTALVWPLRWSCNLVACC